MTISNNISIDDLFNKSINTLEKLDPGTIFTLKELFTNLEWNHISSKDKRKLGYMFYKHVHVNEYRIVTSIGKNLKNQRKYMKKR